VTAKPDPLIHPITRLSICGLLAAGADWVEFAALRDAARISDSVLSKQSRVLEDAGYVEVRKGAVGRRPRTWFRLTAEGRQAVQGHLAWLAQLEEAFSASTQDVRQARPIPVAGQSDTSSGQSGGHRTASVAPWAGEARTATGGL
jgi:DNA-binding HxlR family transcriptional regulator